MSSTRWDIFSIARVNRTKGKEIAVTSLRRQRPTMSRVLFIERNPYRRLLLAAATLPVFALAGCPDDMATTPAQATAPAIQTTTPQPAPPSTSHASTPAPQRQQAAVATTQRTNSKLALTAQEQQLIDRVNTTYQSGVENYRNGRMDAARLDFDFAVDMMLTSKEDLKSEGPMADEFDRIVSAVNALEMDSLKQGNGFSPRAEESPVEAAGDLTFAPNPELNARVAAELQTTHSDLPLVVNDYVTGYINYFTNNATGHAHLLRSLERAGKYEAMIKKILREEGVPEDFIYQAVAESGFQTQVVNAKTGAAGMWQFMPFRGAYGLERNGWFDERFDPEKSTRAYARYMKSLYDQLGDWYLVMAGYDWGPGNIQRAVMRTGYADFWKLYQLNALPKETKNYVPAMLAATIMAKNPQQYGLSNMVPEAAVESDTVTVDYALDLRLVADVTNSQLATIVGLNPSLLRLQTPPDISFDLHIPKNTKALFQKRIASIPEDKRSTWRFHEVKEGETIDQLSQLFHVRPSELATANGIKQDEEVEAGDELIVPVSAPSSTGAHPQSYRVRRGDTLITIADRFGVSAEDLRHWNHVSTNTVAVGHTLYVSEPVHLAPSTRVHSGTARRKRSNVTTSHSNTTNKSASKSASKKKKK